MIKDGLHESSIKHHHSRFVNPTVTRYNIFFIPHYKMTKIVTEIELT